MAKPSFLLLLLITIADYTTAQAQNEVKRRRPYFYFDPIHPDVHDPVMAWEGDSCYVFGTGMGISVMASGDGMNTWHSSQRVLKVTPQWAEDSIRGYRGYTWAPDIQRVGDKWYLYYSCSTFGRNLSAIGVAVNSTLNTTAPGYHWHDLGLVIMSRPHQNDWNAIDPNLLIDQKGQAWLTFGSFWDGIQQVQLANDLRTPQKKVRTIARRRNPESIVHHTITANANAIEAPFLIYHEGFYYLFVSYDYCCKGLQSNYKTAVGRARHPNGPFRDKTGKKMTKGGGTLLISETDEYAGVGHCGVYQHEGQWWFVAHGYDKQSAGESKLVLKKMIFVDGWPTLE